MKMTMAWARLNRSFRARLKFMPLWGALFLVTACVTVTEDGKDEPSFSTIDIADARIALGLEYLKLGSMSKAHENLQRALTIAPTYAQSILSMAYYYQRVDERDKARQLYVKAIKNNPSNGDVFNNYGVFLCEDKHYQASFDAFAKALSSPHYYDMAATYENAGICAQKALDFDKAVSYFNKALNHDPNRARSWYYLILLEIEQGKLARARDLLARYDASSLSADQAPLLMKLKQRLKQLERTDARYEG